MEPLTLIKGASVYAPSPLGTRDILLGGGRILAIDDDLGSLDSLKCRRGTLETLEGKGFIAVPGLIDGHAHITGGGGEGGFTTRTPEMAFRDIVSAGVTTVVGTLGTDGITRGPAGLVAKTKALKEEGLSAWCRSGSYQLPLVTLTENLTGDIVLIEEIIGAGEVALSDHRSSNPSSEALIELASQARIGGMLSGKSGTVVIHMGDGKEGLKRLREAVSHSDIPITQFIPTHMGRNPRLLQEALEWIKQGGWADFTTGTTDQFIKEGEVRSSKALKWLLSEGAPAHRITFSSDAGGSLPVFNEKGEMTGMTVGTCHSLLDELQRAVQDEKIPLETALSVMTANPAGQLKLKGKGRLTEGYDADLLLLNSHNLELEKVFLKGREFNLPFHSSEGFAR